MAVADSVVEAGGGGGGEEGFEGRQGPVQEERPVAGAGRKGGVRVVKGYAEGGLEEGVGG